MRVLWLTENYPPDRGGMAESCDRIVAGLRAAGVVVDLVHLSRRSPWLRSAVRSGGLEVRAPSGPDPAHALNVLWSWLSARRAEWTHVVAFGGELPVLAGPSYAAWLGAPLITCLRGNDFDAAVFSPRRRPILAEALTTSACVCAVAGSMVQRVRAQWPEVDVRLTSNGIDPLWEASDGDRTRAAEWRSRHVPAGRLVLGLIGHLKAKKGATLLLEAVRRSGRGSGLHVLIAGPIDLEVSQWLERFGPEFSCTVESERERLELLPLYLACDLVAIPSYYDGLPNACLEAMALGVPVLAARAGGLADVVDESVGLTFAPGEVEELRLALERAVELGVDGLRVLGAAAAARVASDFTAQQEIDRYLDVLGAV